MENEKDESKKCCEGDGKKSCCKSGKCPMLLGIIIFVLGFFMLAQQAGWIKSTIPFWPIAVIVVGAMFIHVGAKKRG